MITWILTDEIREQIARLLPRERLGDGRPSVQDFIEWDLYPLGDYMAEHWDELPMTFPGHERYRTLIQTGRYVAAVVLTGELINDIIFLREIDIDM